MCPPEVCPETWIEFRDKLYRAPAGIYGMADEFATRIPKKFRSKLIRALGNAVHWSIPYQLIKAMIEAETRDRRNAALGLPPDL